MRGRGAADARYLYVADDAFFPYGSHAKRRWSTRLLALMGELIASRCARSRRHRLQHRLHAGAAATARALPGAVHRHGAGDQAGLRSLGQQAGLGAGHAGHRRARIHQGADPRLRQRRPMSRWSVRRSSPRSPRRSCTARAWRMQRSRPRSPPASSTPAGGAPTRSCWPARITRCSSMRSPGWRPGRCVSSIPPPRSHGEPLADGTPPVPQAGETRRRAKPASSRAGAHPVHLRPPSHACPIGFIGRFRARRGSASGGLTLPGFPPRNRARKPADKRALRFATRGLSRRFGKDLSVPASS